MEHHKKSNLLNEANLWKNKRILLMINQMEIMMQKKLSIIKKF